MDKRNKRLPMPIIFFLALLTFLASANFHTAEAQQPGKVPQIGVISPRDPVNEASRSEAIRLALRELGYIEGQNIAIEYRYAEGKINRLPELAAEMVRRKVDIILVVGDPAIRAAKNATKTIPIIMTGPGSDPVKAGFITSLAQPGGNLTGLTTLTREVAGKRLEQFKEVVPKLARVAVLYDAASPSIVRDVKEDLPVAARALGLTLQDREVRSAENLDRVLASLSTLRPDGLYASSGPLMRTHQKRIVDLTLKGRLPSIYYDRESVEAGGLMSYGADLAASYRRVAYYVDRILKGAKPADLPVEQPKKFELVINLKTAKQIGVTIPPSVLARADRVIR